MRRWVGGPLPQPRDGRPRRSCPGLDISPGHLVGAEWSRRGRARPGGRAAGRGRANPLTPSPGVGRRCLGRESMSRTGHRAGPRLPGPMPSDRIRRSPPVAPARRSCNGRGPSARCRPHRPQRHRPSGRRSRRLLLALFEPNVVDADLALVAGVQDIHRLLARLVVVHDEAHGEASGVAGPPVLDDDAGRLPPPSPPD